MKQHLRAGFVISRTTQYMFLKSPKPVSRRETLEDRECKPSHPVVALAIAAGSNENKHKLAIFLCL